MFIKNSMQNRMEFHAESRMARSKHPEQTSCTGQGQAIIVQSEFSVSCILTKRHCLLKSIDDMHKYWSTVKRRNTKLL
jgi:hypothetical protein